MKSPEVMAKAKSLIVETGMTARATAAELGMSEKQVCRWVNKYNWKAMQSDARMQRQLIIMGLGVSRAEVVEDFKAYLTDHYPELASQLTDPAKQYLQQFKSLDK